jgi:hypothetical protein
MRRVGLHLLWFLISLVQLGGANLYFLVSAEDFSYDQMSVSIFWEDENHKIDSEEEEYDFVFAAFIDFNIQYTFLCASHRAMFPTVTHELSPAPAIYSPLII